MTIGIGGAGSKLAARLDDGATLINVSETELNKVLGGGRRIVAPVSAAGGQFKGSRKSPQIGLDAYRAMRRELQDMIKGEKVFSSTGGGTGNGILTGILHDLAERDSVPMEDKTFFGLILPYAPMESSEFVMNTTDFLSGAVAEAIDSGNTGNIVLFSNKVKFEKKLSEEEYNKMLAESLKVLLSVPEKNEKYRLLDEHIDYEDFALFLSKPYFNHFTGFNYDSSKPFGEQLLKNVNPLLLPPEEAIEAMFILEVPRAEQATQFYSILQYFVGNKVSPIYSVLENPELEAPFVTVALLYSRKPAELVEDFNRISEEHVQVKVERSLEQHIVLPKLNVNLEKEASRAISKKGQAQEDILATLKRLGKI